MSQPSPETARDVILSRIRRGLEGAPRPARPQAHTVPMRGAGEANQRLATFIAEAERAGATLQCLEAEAAVPVALATHLKKQGSGVRVRLAPSVAGLHWASAPGLETETGAPEDGDGVGVSRAFAGVAETGTLVLLSGADNPTRLNLLPLVHVVVVAAADIVGAYEDAWRMLRESRAGEAPMMPRTVNWITGPSRTADLEQTLLMGAHGPKELHILIVGK